jgi:hypothetical protein
MEKGADLSKFARDVDVHFAQKRRKQALENAREIMLNDHHDTVVVDVPTLRFLAANESKSQQSSESTMPDSYFKFPKCKCRQGTLALIKLAQQLLDEAITQPAHSFVLWHNVYLFCYSYETDECSFAG